MWDLEIKFVEKLTSFSKTKSLQRELFLTMFYTINLSPLLVIKKGFMMIIILSNYQQCPQPLTISQLTIEEITWISCEELRSALNVIFTNSEPINPTFYFRFGRQNVLFNPNSIETLWGLWETSPRPNGPTRTPFTPRCSSSSELVFS